MHHPFKRRRAERLRIGWEPQLPFGKRAKILNERQHQIARGSQLGNVQCERLGRDEALEQAGLPGAFRAENQHGLSLLYLRLQPRHFLCAVDGSEVLDIRSMKS
jgi:hypothetical protein